MHILAQDIQEILKKLNSREHLLILFREKLGFNPPSSPTVPFDFDNKLVCNADLIAEFGPFHIYHIILRHEFDNTFASERQIRSIVNSA